MAFWSHCFILITHFIHSSCKIKYVHSHTKLLGSQILWKLKLFRLSLSSLVLKPTGMTTIITEIWDNKLAPVSADYQDGLAHCFRFQSSLKWHCQWTFANRFFFSIEPKNLYRCINNYHLELSQNCIRCNIIMNFPFSVTENVFVMTGLGFYITCC